MARINETEQGPRSHSGLGFSMVLLLACPQIQPTNNLRIDIYKARGQGRHGRCHNRYYSPRSDSAYIHLLLLHYDHFVRAFRALPVKINVRKERIEVLDWLPRIDVDRKHASLLLPCALCDYHVIPCAAPPWRPGACASYRVSGHVQ
jgi:hypothetical protein